VHIDLAIVELLAQDLGPLDGFRPEPVIDQVLDLVASRTLPGAVAGRRLTAEEFALLLSSLRVLSISQNVPLIGDVSHLLPWP
jgi:hypothetical protein